MAIAVAIAAAVSVISLTAIARVQWPAFPSSNQLHALTTVGQVGCILGLLCAGWASRRGRRTVAQLLALVFVSAFSVVTLGMPLGATKLYLFGISVDQQFRTEYLTRLTDSSSLHDMTYMGLPPFYPPGWFWVGGRVAALTGTPGWETFKPWAITSITIAIAVALVLWSRMIRFEYALIVSTATAAVTLAYSSPEPYSAMITVLLPPVLILTWSGLRGATRGGGWAAVIGGGLFLGVAATCYTLLTAYSAFTMALMAVALTASRRRDGLKAALDPLLRLVVIGAIAAAIASITWLPFLLRAVHDPVSNTGSAFHYLPADGAELTFPMLKFTLLGALCLLGTLWLVVRARASVRAGGLAIGVLAVYLWSLLSMLATLARTTLLSFRLQPTLTVLLTAAGVFGFVEATLAVKARGRERAWGRAVLPVAASIGLAAAIAFSQDIPDVLRPDLTIAYTDTDGHGQRGDRRPPSSEKFYPEIDAAITTATGQAARPDGGVDRRLQLPVLLPVLRLPGPDVALRQPAGAVRQARGRDQGLGQAQNRRPVRPRAGHAAVGAADRVPDAARRLGGRVAQQLHPAACRGRLSQPAERAPLHRGAQCRDIRRPAIHRHQDRPLRAGRP